MYVFKVKCLKIVSSFQSPAGALGSLCSLAGRRRYNRKHGRDLVLPLPLDYKTLCKGQSQAFTWAHLRPPLAHIPRAFHQLPWSSPCAINSISSKKHLTFSFTLCSFYFNEIIGEKETIYINLHIPEFYTLKIWPYYKSVFNWAVKKCNEREKNAISKIQSIGGTLFFAIDRTGSGSFKRQYMMMNLRGMGGGWE